MNIARALPDRLEEHGVDQPNDGGFVCGIEEVLRLIQLVSNLIQAFTGRDILHHLLCACGARRFVIHTIQAGQER